MRNKRWELQLGLGLIPHAGSETRHALFFFFSVKPVLLDTIPICLSRQNMLLSALLTVIASQ